MCIRDSVNGRDWIRQLAKYGTYNSNGDYFPKWKAGKPGPNRKYTCLLYTSDAADERSSVDLGGRRIIKKKKPDKKWNHSYNTNQTITQSMYSPTCANTHTLYATTPLEYVV